MSVLENLYREHHSWLQCWLSSRLDQASDAEDLSQDTFFRVLTRGEMETIREPRSYILTIARGLTIDLYRRRSLEKQYLEALASLPEAEHPSAEEHCLIMETLIQLDDMLSGLGDKVRQVFILSQFDGLTYEQIADQLGISRRTVVNYMSKAMEHCCLFRIEHGL